MMRARCLLLAMLLPALAPAGAAAQTSPLWPVQSNLPGLAGARIRAEQLATRRSSNVVIMGLLERGLPFSGVFRLLSETKRVLIGGDVIYEVQYTSEPLPDALWNGDAVFEDLTGDNRADILMMGDTRRDSAAAPAPLVVLYSEVAPARVRLLPALPALSASRFALRGNLLATAGRGAGGLVLDVYGVTRAATPVFTRQAQLPGLEFPALALGDCDADGDSDLFAAGIDAAGLPVARIYRNDGGAFTPGAALPGLFRGEASFGDLDGNGTADLAYSGFRYGPGLAEGAVYVYRMNGCVPTPVAVPAPMQGMMGEFVALEDVTDDGRADLVVSGLVEPFRARLSYLRIATGNGAGTFTPLERSDRFTVGVGSGTLLTLPTGGPRPAFVGIGVAQRDALGVWFFSRPDAGL